MDPKQTNKQPDPEQPLPPKDLLLDRSGGFDPVLVALSDVLPDEAFQLSDLL